MMKRNDIDIQIIGSDISQRAIETSMKNCEYAGIQNLIDHELLTAKSHRFINHPMILSQYYPKFRKD